MATGGAIARCPPAGAQTTNSDGANIIPVRGLAHLVSKFETLEKASGAYYRKPTALHPSAGLTASKTMSSLNSLQDNRRYFERSLYRDVGHESSATSTPAVAAAAAMGRTDISRIKPGPALPNKTRHKDRISISVAEKRKLFEADESSLRDTPGSQVQSPNLPKKATANILQSENSAEKISTSQSCGHIYSTPKKAPSSPTRRNLGVSSVQNSHHRQREILQSSSVHPVPALSVVLRVHHDADGQHSMRDDALRRLSKVDAFDQTSPRKTLVSSTGSPSKSPSKLVIKTVSIVPEDSCPPSKEAIGHVLSASPPNAIPGDLKRHSTSSVTPKASIESDDSIVISKRGQSVPQLARGWSPQRIVTPQKPTMPQKTSPGDQAAGHGTFVKPKNPENFRDALGFFEAMSYRDSLNSSAPTEAANRLSHEPQSAKRTGKRDKLKGSFRKISSSLRLKRVRTTAGRQALSEYPAMWKLGSIEATPRKRLHAEWCEVSADTRQPLKASNVGEISLFDPYLSSHAKMFRDGEHTHGHMDILLQQSSLHGNFYAADESVYGTNYIATDCSRSPVQVSPKTLSSQRRSSRRWFSRSSGALVSQAHCRLEQPRPVYGVEMKRLISLCKLQGSVKRRGHTE